MNDPSRQPDPKRELQAIAATALDGKLCHCGRIAVALGACDHHAPPTREARRAARAAA